MIVMRFAVPQRGAAFASHGRKRSPHQPRLTVSGLTRRSSGPTPAGQTCGFSEHCARRCGPLNSGVRPHVLALNKNWSYCLERSRLHQTFGVAHHQSLSVIRRLRSVLNANVQGLIGVADTLITSAVAVASGNPTAFFRQRPNPAFKRTHTGGAACGFSRFPVRRCGPLNSGVRPHAAAMNKRWSCCLESSRLQQTFGVVHHRPVRRCGGLVHARSE